MIIVARLSFVLFFSVALSPPLAFSEFTAENLAIQQKRVHAAAKMVDGKVKASLRDFKTLQNELSAQNKVLNLKAQELSRTSPEFVSLFETAKQLKDKAQEKYEEVYRHFASARRLIDQVKLKLTAELGKATLPTLLQSQVKTLLIQIYKLKGDLHWQLRGANKVYQIEANRNYQRARDIQAFRPSRSSSPLSNSSCESPPDDPFSILSKIVTVERPCPPSPLGEQIKINQSLLSTFELKTPALKSTLSFLQGKLPIVSSQQSNTAPSTIARAVTNREIESENFYCLPVDTFKSFLSLSSYLETREVPFDHSQLLVVLKDFAKEKDKWIADQKNIPIKLNQTENGARWHFGLAGDIYLELLEDPESLLGTGIYKTVSRMLERNTDGSFDEKAIASPNDGGRKSSLEGFENEEAIIKKINSFPDRRGLIESKVIPILDSKGMPTKWIVSPVYEEGDLFNLLFSEKPPSSDTVLNYLGQVARGIFNLHKEEILHQDLKPENVLVDSESKKVAITDFGFAVDLDNLAILESQTSIQGSPGYIAPESFGRSFGKGTPEEKRQRAKKRDVFSFGMMLADIVAGRLPDSNSYPGDIIKKAHQICIKLQERRACYSKHVNKLRTELESLAKKAGDSRGLLLLATQALQVNPDSRPSSEQVLREFSLAVGHRF